MVKRYQGKVYDAQPKYGGASHTSSVIVYQRPSETNPLLPNERNTTRISPLAQIGCLFFTLVLVGLFTFTAYYTCIHWGCPPDPATRDAIRQEWEKQVAYHTDLEHKWQRWEEEHDEMEQDWLHARERHEQEVARRIHDEHVREERVREEWALETERHVREFEEMQRREREERERDRENWKREVEERDRREEEERQKRHMYWGNVEAHTCVTYATREYTAQLMNLPTDWKHRLDACKATPLEIHGVSYLPKTCLDKGPGVVIGRWEINQQEPDCTTYWDSYNDKGCTSPGSGKKHITQHLMSVPDKRDWHEFCATTPAHFDHMQFPGAQECFSSIWGVYGRWEIDDDNC